MRCRGIVAALLAVTLLAPSTAGAARSEFFGIIQEQQLSSQDFTRLGTARIRSQRILLNWSKAQPTQSSFDWAASDQVIGRSASHGIRALPFVWGNPGWMAGSPGTPPLGSAAAREEWEDFLRAAVARYGTGGSYWANGYRQQFGANATPMPIQSWQIWNEPNLAKFFAPSPSPTKYLELLQISKAAITGQDQQARIVLAGMLAYPNPKAWDFLDSLYEAGAKPYFDAAALHPYASSIDRVKNALEQFRRVMKEHNDGQTPLWVTEIGWGSNPPDSGGINKGLEGQKTMLTKSFQLVLANRRAWNVQRLFWYFWRDPATHEPGMCSFCSSSGLLRYNGTAKPAYPTFLGFTGETDPPQARITSGPSAGSSTNDSTPSFSFTSDEPGSTFVCRVNAGAFKSCSSPHTLAPLADGARTFRVKAIDAPGNESPVVSRTFTVDTQAPQTTITSGPSGPTTNRRPTFGFASSEAGSTFRCRFDSQPFAACSGPGASHRPATSLSYGPHSFAVRATDKAKNTDPSPASRSFTVIPTP